MLTCLARILVVDDDPGIAGVVQFALESSNYQVTHVADGRSGLESALSGQYDLMVLDVNLPGLDGLSVCRELKRRCSLPVLMLSARQQDSDKILGLEIGADDYLGKPFNPLELVARVRALLRRGAGVESGGLLRIGQLEIDPEAHWVRLAQQELHLTAKEFEVLLALARQPRRVFTRQQLMDSAWGSDWVGDEKTVEVHLRRIRKKMLDLGSQDYIQAVRGVGYRLTHPSG